MEAICIYCFYHGFGLKAFEGRHIRIINIIYGLFNTTEIQDRLFKILLYPETI